MRMVLVLSMLLALPAAGLAQIESLSNTTGTVPAVQGQHINGNQGALGALGYGAYGQHQASGNFGGLGEATAGVSGLSSTSNFGQLGSLDYGAYGQHLNGNIGYLGSTEYGVFGSHGSGNLGYIGSADYGIWGQHSTGTFGFLAGTLQGSTPRGVHGQHPNGNWGYLGGDNSGLFATGSPWAGYFMGNVNVTGTLSKGGGSFKIDHPLDPANRYLSHSFVESPDMKNVYDGNTTTDAEGFATVTLPSYFEALNRDFRYQLTVIGQFAQAIVAQEIQGNRFVIRTDKPGVKVSWQVTGIRQNAWAEANRIVVEQDKPAVEQGFYLHPALYSQPAERSVEWARDPEGMRVAQEMPQRMQAERVRVLQAQPPRPGENR